MRTRRLLLPLLLAPLCLALGCTGSPDVPPADAAPGANEKPQAPPPHEKKTTAEVLVGSWKVVSTGGSKVSDDYMAVTEYSRDGTMVRRVEKSRNGVIPPPRKGTYRLEGKTLHFTTEATTESRAQSWSVEIHSISDAKLILVAGEDNQETEYVRVPSK